MPPALPCPCRISLSALLIASIGCGVGAASSEDASDAGVADTGMVGTDDGVPAAAPDDAADGGSGPSVLGGVLSGLGAGTVTLQDNTGDTLTLHANGAFVFATPIQRGHGYDVTVLADPASQSCSVSSGTGTAQGAPVITTVRVSCVSNVDGTAIGVGFAHACALLPGGTVDCWGTDFTAAGPSTTPSPVSGLAGASSLSVGGYFACALSSGTVDCWGDNGNGELGSGTMGFGSETPGPVSGLHGVMALTAGYAHACALLSGGAVACWGDNYSGQLGDGTMTSSSTPVPIAGLHGVTAVFAGPYYTCALGAGGSVQCWGTDPSGHWPTPHSVGGLRCVTAIAAGDQHACALVSGGTVECWGDNSYGQVGSAGVGGTLSAPRPLVGLSDVIAVTAGDSFTCALLSGGTVECLGKDDSGQLGNGAVTTSPTSTPVAVSGLAGVTRIAAGASSASVCALLADGAVECWGNNFAGQLGNGTSTRSDVPVVVH